MESLKIKDQMYLVAVPVEAATRTRSTAVSHLWIFDRSGSMTSELPGLVTDLIKKSKELTPGDLLSIGWFSGEGQYRFVLKGHRVADDNAVENILYDLRRSVGATCFSEILCDAVEVVKELRHFDLNTSLVFLSDGYPQVYNYRAEIEKIHAACRELGTQVTSSLLVGYGHYYNKELMSEMASRLGGALIHSSAIHEFSSEVSGFISDSREMDTRIEHELDCEFAISFVGKTVHVMEPQEGKILVAPTTTKSHIYYLSKKPVGAQVKDLGTRWLRACYAMSYALSSRTRVSEAIDILAVTGDVALLKGITNAFTNEEYGVVEGRIREALHSQKARFTEGQNTDFLPDPNAFCIVDLVELLQNDSGVQFLPYRIDYKRIGVAQESVDTALKFTAEDEPRSALNGIVWHGTRLNLSIRARINGHVELPEDAEAHGYARRYPTFVWRNYTLVKDGCLNIKELQVVNLSETVNNTLVSLGLITETPDSKIIHLDRIPVMNRGMAASSTSAKSLCKQVWEETVLESSIKALGAQIPESVAEKNEYLASHGITPGGFNPKVKSGDERPESTDFYMAKEFDIKIKSYSTLPKVTDTRKKMLLKEAKFTPSESLMAESLREFDTECQKNTGFTPVDVAQKLLDIKRAELRKVRTRIQRVKFALLLGKQSFDEFKSRDDMSLEVDGKTFTIAIREVRVPI